jgi:hypothetical protein
MDSSICRNSVLPLRCLWLAIFGALMFAGCGGGGDEPRMRMGAFFGSPGGMSYPDSEHLGKHGYRYSRTEKDGGLVYTSSGGFIDIGHVREAADRAAYASRVSYNNLVDGRRQFTLRLVDPSLYCVSISYPVGWDNMPLDQRQRLAREACIPLGLYVAHRSLVWHEIITGYGFSSTGIFSEKISSFSFEDTYSDATGIALGGQALRDSRPYDDAMTDLLEKKLKALGAQSPDVARMAVSKIDGRWYTGNWYFFVHMKEPSFDVGQDKGYITPKLVPGVCQGATPAPCPVPTLDTVTRLGFWVTVEIDPRIWEQNKILRTVHTENSTDMIRPDVHFPEIIDKMSHQLR